MNTKNPKPLTNRQLAMLTVATEAHLRKMNDAARERLVAERNTALKNIRAAVSANPLDYTDKLYLERDYLILKVKPNKAFEDLVRVFEIEYDDSRSSYVDIVSYILPKTKRWEDKFTINVPRSIEKQVQAVIAKAEALAVTGTPEALLRFINSLNKG